MTSDTLQGIFQTHTDPATLAQVEQYASWTLPNVFVDTRSLQNTTNRNSTYRDFQSFGALITNYLAAKLTQALFPVKNAFFRIAIPPEGKDALLKLAKVDSDGLDAWVGKLERNACDSLFEFSNYATLHDTLKKLIITGNALLRWLPNGQLVAYSMRNYTCLRDGSGRPMQVVLKEQLAWRSLPKEIQSVVAETADNAPVDVYTGIKWNYVDGHASTVEIHQECGAWEQTNKQLIPAQTCPYLPVVWNLVPGESYGRGLVEDHAGDFARYSEVSRALTLYELEAAKVVYGVKPGGTADISELNKAECGQYVLADADAIKAIETVIHGKITELRTDIEALEMRLSRAFNYSANMRQAERVTAIEVQLNAQEADRTFGGTYSTLSAALHIPLAYLLLQRVAPLLVVAVIAKQLSISLRSGVPALGRSADVTALLQAAQEAKLILDCFANSPRVSPEKVIEVCLTARGFDSSLIYRTPAELQQLATANQPLNPSDPATVQNITGVLNNA